MKHRSSLLLMEQLVMILVFALCAALCLQAFVAADNMAKSTALQDEAVLLAQNTAESLKAGGPVPEAPEALRLEVIPLVTGLSGLAKAEITVFSAETGDTIFALTVGWQEVGS